ncbi:nuclear transport factor 2 family protein [Alkalisalibacterium limincola]|uniref:Nuclear transport factor 2 family protein n=1 Tax=Alkalisalibacterium limincola TaxID=2699169 RepID=A0A5C8KVS4_9GAMM|nr:nuclear transport factor 2 family protein [Alkalisalibacterium limincola]TXK64430.1 nuclear transport factor 2 family protein [Alkalisalibacterium limincola]
MASLLLAGGCARPDPEQALRDRIAAMQEAARERSASGVLAGIDDDFSGPHGLDREGLGRLVRLQFMQHGSVGVRLGPLDVEMFEERARVRFTAVLTGGSGRFVPDTGRIYNVETAWRRDGNDWRLIIAQWD